MQKFPYISWIFKERHKSFTLNFPVRDVVDLFDKIPTSIGMWSDNDFKLKSFDGKAFIIQLIQTSGGYRISPNLVGIITPIDEHKTVIESTIKNNPFLIFMFFVSLIIGLVFLIQFLLWEQVIKNIFSAIFMLCLLYFIVWYKKVTEYTIRERFEKYLAKSLR